MASDLMTVDEWLVAVGRSSADADDTELERVGWAITVASQAVRQYIDRDVTLAAEATPGERTFRYYGNAQVEIDDCTAITAVSIAATPWNPAPRPLTDREYVPGATSSNLPVFDYLELWTNLPLAQSPAMGFTWNADTYAAMYGTRGGPLEVAVTAAWGWPEIPPQMKQAVVWTAGDVLADDSPYMTESIAGYSHSYRDTRGGGGGQGGGTTSPSSMAVPPRAQALLDPYLRVNV